MMIRRPRNERREEQEQRGQGEKDVGKRGLQDYEWWRRGKCLL